MREIKFRAFADGELTRPFSLKDDYKAIGYYYSRGFIVEQFTGLHDKNGKEIYEGDIIILGTNKPCIVNYDNQRACFSADLIGRGNTCFHTDFWEKGEIIGNRNENPELING